MGGLRESSLFFGGSGSLAGYGAVYAHSGVMRKPPTLLTAISLAFLAFSLSGCAWRVMAPPPPTDPVTVHLTAYALHSRVAVPDEEGTGRMIEYGFGDWDYYALQRTGAWRGFRALFFSRASAFSRRELPARDDPEAFRVLAGGKRTLSVEVERERADALREELEARWHALDSAGADFAIRAGSGVELRRTEERYHLFRNSNHRSATWMRELGCEVRGTAITNRFREAVR